MTTILDQAFVSTDAHRELGVGMAQALLHQANRPGVLRTMFYRMTEHTCPEWTDDEYNRARRIQRRTYRLTLRQIVRELRKH